MRSTSAPSPKRYPKRAFSAAYGPFDIDSMPPATATRFSSALIRRIACTIAIRPDAQTLLIVSNVVVLASPALKSAWRAGAWPTPAWITLPMITCSISAGSSFARSTAARIASPPSVVAESETSAPPSLPNGVRAVLRTTVFDFIRS